MRKVRMVNMTLTRHIEGKRDGEKEANELPGDVI